MILENTSTCFENPNLSMLNRDHSSGSKELINKNNRSISCDIKKAKTWNLYYSSNISNVESLEKTGFALLNAIK